MESPCGCAKCCSFYKPETAIWDNLRGICTNLFEKGQHWNQCQLDGKNPNLGSDEFRTFSIFPTAADMKSDEHQQPIRSNIIKGRFPSVNDYLDIHFRLMKEDFVAPLRKALRQLTENGKVARGSGVYVYEQTQFRNPRLDLSVCATFIDLVVSYSKLD
eukprot:Gregarina_sp_Poly_1__8119@NODE_468_length_8160_cov_51_068578_g380_i0_p3_GENE_NODE_468_length_8160_cov_51_068578_g380_i0NODE_468_length_8160_cov_51_068578_g380_i0_p3_ORF_typecomplete_len159_score13_58ParD_antitoxin/PF03693_14/0_076GntR/PF00392_21/3e03GntR/PF00392_21/0_42_NODE_468_length_8160_cov_51_068578_g380_i064146890